MTQEYIPDRYHDYLNNVIPSAWDFKSHLTVSLSTVNQYTAATIASYQTQRDRLMAHFCTANTTILHPTLP